MKSPPTLLTSQATVLIHGGVLVQVVAIRACSPERRGPRRVAASIFLHYRLLRLLRWRRRRRLRWPTLRLRTSDLRECACAGTTPPHRHLHLLCNGGRQINHGEEAELPIEDSLLAWVGEDRPGGGDELESVIGVRVLVLVGVEEEGEASVLPLDELLIISPAVDLEDGVPVILVVDAAVGGEEDVDDGEDLFGALEERLGLLSQEGEFPGAVEIPGEEELLGYSEQPLGFDSAVHLLGIQKQRGACPDSYVRNEDWGIFTVQ